MSVSDFAIIGKKSIRFESNHGECGFESNWSDCENDILRELNIKFPKKAKNNNMIVAIVVASNAVLILSLILGVELQLKIKLYYLKGLLQ